MRRIFERFSTPPLGSEKRGEQLVDWSIEKAAPGTRYTVAHPTGLTLHFVAAKEEPKVYIHWNPAKFKNFRAGIKDTDQIVMTIFGICLEWRKENTKIRILGAGKTGVVLWDEKENSFCQQKKDDDVNYLTGMIKFAAEGPLFHSEVECQEELQLVTALAVYDTKEEETKKLEEVMPKEKETPQDFGNYLLRDALINQLLKTAS